MRFRNISILIGSVAAFLFIFLSDPALSPGLGLAFGAQTVLAVKSIVTLSLAALVLHLSRKTLFDYLDVSKFFEKANETPQGSGLALIGLGLVLIAFAIVFGVLVFLL